MKAITLTQPWASLVAVGAKTIETRSWSTNYRGPLAIHAAKGWKRADRDLLLPTGYGGTTNPFYRALSPFVPSVDADRGHVIAIVTLIACRHIGWDGLNPMTLTEEERAFGNYQSGRYAWVLDNVRILAAPVPARGALGLWEWDNPEERA